MRTALAALLAALPLPAWAAPDFSALAAQAAEHLSRLVRVNTVNPPGNEREACDYVAGVLAKERIPFDILESTPGRASLVARVKGDGSRKPLLLLSHLDTVGVEEARWSFPPFSGRSAAGMIEGRGSIDDKSMTAAALAVLVALSKERPRLKRDVILAAVADEESGGSLGIRWLLERHSEKILAEYAVNEGGTTQLKDGKVRVMALSALEKRYFDIRLTARGSGGHAAVPHPDNAIYTLARGLSNLGSWEPAMRLNPVTRAYFSGVLPLEVGRTRRAIEDALSDDPLRRVRGGEALRSHPYYHAMAHDTVVPTVVSAGIRENVVASEAWANLNARLLPDTDPDVFLDELRRAVDEPSIEIKVTARPPDPPPAAMPLDNEFFSAFERVARRLSPGVVVVPSMAAGSTDSEVLRRSGVLTYGFEFPLTYEDEARIHGNDERIPMDSLAFGARFFYELALELGR